MDNKPNVFPEKPSGLDLEKQSRSSGRGGAFSLTSLFIELIDVRALVSVQSTRRQTSTWPGIYPAL
jgi:hypothetical protein